jgi:tRNA threonylcarbamoyl adenosine modification protein (Sua5/YciO/YrdC/YwlC family)
VRYLDVHQVGEDEVLTACAAAFERGEIVIFPTDTVYGIGCRPDRLDAVKRIYHVKGRSGEKPLSILLDSVDCLLRYGEIVAPQTAAAARRFLPGGMTMIVNRPSRLNAAVTAGRATVGLRVPDDGLLRRVLARVGPLASTSANISGVAAYDGTGPIDVLAADLFLYAGPTRFRRESSVIDFTRRPPEMLREGVLPRERFTTWLAASSSSLR